MGGRLAVSVGQHSEAGRKAVNQDFHGVVQPGGQQLASKGIALALADGISSSAVSQVASAAAVRTFLEDYYCTAEAWTVRRAAQRVLAAVNAWLHAQTRRSDARFDLDRGYVCTFSALIFKAREAHMLHVGDARIFRLHPQQLEQLTDDHRVQVSSAESYLSRALGAGPAIEIDYRSWEVEPGEIYLLATDGAYAYLDAADVRQALAAHGDDLDGAARHLVAMALERGSPDNATLQIARVDNLPDPDAPGVLAQGGRLALPPPLAPRMQFEGYTIVRQLHASARSHVHLAVDDLTGQYVALKTPAVDRHEDVAHLDGFLLEEWVARRIDNQHVLRPHAVDRPRRHLYVAMEYVEGQTLAQWMIDHRQPGLDAVRAIVAQLAAGLRAFHRREMLHQDLRPENVIIDRAGTARIMDFATVHVAGLAEGTRSPLATLPVGTLQYAAPEYFVGEGGTAASDLFSLAVLAYQMLTGHLPYGLQVTQLRSRADLRRLRYVPLRERRPDLPPWVDTVLRKALHPDAARRHEALSEFVEALRAPGPHAVQRLARPLIERNPLRFWQALSLALAVLVAVLAGLRVTGV
ncbi:bifunctional protein-serine/threonine kinase/phosphatase [Cupriavidus agavae]|uniref:Serine/threonine protein kinase n=1 Tax=Cupriavidus agavae TaxID=1001822 RepID=A0A4Q7RCE3_9BURK|nr:bifunctional protein-serine/threonine kinase/phosphatase [Cupriavidus agavae]RZT30774.1 serine/threonine protein kinase [Cupriavidus agavae]